MKGQQQSARQPVDSPIAGASSDTLGRGAHAVTFARFVLSLSTESGVVVGVLGQWGSGKTSYLNLAREVFAAEKAEVLAFNPWMFSGADQLVHAFFSEVAAQLKLRPSLAEIGENIGEYGEAISSLSWLPVVGKWIERGRAFGKLAGKLMFRDKGGSATKRARLEIALRKLARPLIILIDDVDRLSTTEIRDIFKLVRLTASFPNVVYVVAFDRLRVEQALSEDRLPGRDYLEKILQLSVDLPIVPDSMLDRQVFESLDVALSATQLEGRFNPGAWPDVYADVIRPLLRNMRDVRRYSLSVSYSLTSIGPEISIVDLLALEAIRVFLPDVHATLPRAIDGLTTASAGLSSRDEPPMLKEQIALLLEAGSSHPKVVRALVSRLFPAAERHIGGTSYGSDFEGRWLKGRRVAHKDVLRLYLERVSNSGLDSHSFAERAFALLSDRPALDQFLRSLPDSVREDTISGLEAFEDDFRPEHVVPGTVVILNLIPDVPERPREMFSFGTRLSLTRVTYRLLRSLKDPQSVAAAVREILPQLRTLSGRLEVISDVGHVEREGHKLVSEPDAAAFERELRDQIRALSGEQLAEEPDVFRLLLVTRHRSRPEEPPLRVPESPALTVALIKAARTETLSNSIGSRAVKRSYRLQWKALVELLGSEDEIRARIALVPAAERLGAEEHLALAEQYLAGYRPDPDDA